MTRRTALILLSLVLMIAAAVAHAQPQQSASANKSPQPTFDVKAAVDAYLNSVPPEARARSDAYFEGGYWLLLWDFLYGAAVSLVLLATGLSARMRDLAARVSRFSAVQTAIYWVEFIVLTSLLSFPLTVYEGYSRA